MSDRLREQIEEQIATGQLAPGSALDEVSMAARFGVSRTPLREALIQLAAEGLVELRPRRGAVVASVGPARLLEMFEVMAELESMCARLAARRMTEVEQAELLAAHRACEEARGDPDAYFYCNERFHLAIYAGSHNGFLAEEAAALQRRLRPYRRLQLRLRDRMANSFAEHEAVVAALQAGDAAGAGEALRRHVSVQGERFGDLVASLRALERGAAERPAAERAGEGRSEGAAERAA